jgi:hypothetical protein
LASSSNSKCTAYLTKPLDIDLLLQTLAERRRKRQLSNWAKPAAASSSVVAAPVFRFSLRKPPITSRLADSFCACLDEMFIPAGSIGDEGFGRWPALRAHILRTNANSNTSISGETLACVQ